MVKLKISEDWYKKVGKKEDKFFDITASPFLRDVKNKKKRTSKRDLMKSINTAFKVSKKPNVTKPLTKAQLVSSLAEQLNMAKKDVNQFFDALNSLAYKELTKRDQFVLPGFGKLIKVKRKASKGRNPATGEEIKIKAKNVVKFKAAKACKDSIKK